MEPNLVGWQLDQYQLLQPIGRGGMGDVYQARYSVHGTIVAVKVLDPQLARDGRFVERFRHEAQVASQLAHPNIVKTYGAGYAQGYHYLVMEYLDGQSLAGWIDHSGALSLDWAAYVLHHVAQALDYAHAAGLVHRDVKPGNIMLSPDGQRVTLLDLGLMKAVDGPQLTQTGQMLGTPHYMSPEQVGGQRESPATDIFSLGVVAYEMLAGRVPFDAPNPTGVWNRIVNEAPPSLQAINPAVPPMVEWVVLVALNKQPTDRWGGTGEFAAQVENARQDRTVLAPPGQLPPYTPPAPSPAQVIPPPGGRDTEPPPSNGDRSWLKWVAAAMLALLFMLCACSMLVGGPVTASTVRGILGVVFPSLRATPTATVAVLPPGGTSTATTTPSFVDLTATTATPTAPARASSSATATRRILPTTVTSTLAPPTATATSVRTPEINFGVNPTRIQRGSCATIEWDVENIREVYLDGEGVAGHGQKKVCPSETTTYTLKVVLVDGSVQERSVKLTVVPPEVPTNTSPPPATNTLPPPPPSDTAPPPATNTPLPPYPSLRRDLLQASVEACWVIWRATVPLIAQRWWLGYGPAAFATMFVVHRVAVCEGKKTDGV